MAATLEKRATEKIYTYEDYASLPEGAPYQLIEGELVMAAAPLPFHQDIVLNIAAPLRAFVSANNVGKVYIAPIDVYLSDANTYQPDIIFIAKSRLEIIGEAKIEGAPDLVVEILSPSTAYYDLKRKKRIYEETGVLEYWIVDPFEKSIEIYENANGFQLWQQAQEQGAITSKLLSGFELTLEQVFAF